ncbi:MAG: cytochrome C oxidase subunit IV family protein [Candidatus Aminicenantales bacterium]
MGKSGAGERPSGVAAASDGTTVAVWVALLFFLGLTIFVARLGMPSFGVAVNLLIATVKAGLVLVFFMHLRSEGRFLKIMLGVAIGALTAMILLTFSDVMFRR